MTVMSAPFGLFQQHISLMHGWVPATVQALAGATLLVALGRRTRRWTLRWLPVAGVVGIAAATVSFYDGCI